MPRSPLEWDVYGHECLFSRLYCPAVETWLAGPFDTLQAAETWMIGAEQQWMIGQNIRWLVVRQRAPK